MPPEPLRLQSSRSSRIAASMALVEQPTGMQGRALALCGRAGDSIAGEARFIRHGPGVCCRM